MGFKTGSIAFRRYTTLGTVPATPTEELVAQFHEHVLQPAELGGGVEEIEYGWGGGRHVLDKEFTFGSNVFNEAMLFGLQVDRNKVPTELKKAWKEIESEILAKQNPSGFLSKLQKKEVRETVERKADEDLRTGKHRRSKITEVLWDLANGSLYSPASGATFEKLAEIFERTTKAELQPVNASSIAQAYLPTTTYEDLRPTAFADNPSGDEKTSPEYPWVARNAYPKAFLGNEFLVWLWYVADAHDGEVKINLPGGRKTELTFMFDKVLELECSYGQGGRTAARGAGPSKSPEARQALTRGKVPRKAYLAVHVDGEQFEFTFDPELFKYSGVRLPAVDNAETERAVIDARIASLANLTKAMESLFKAFLGIRRDHGMWAVVTNDIREWSVRKMTEVTA
jgi:hypothetical protein